MPKRSPESSLAAETTRSLRVGISHRRAIRFGRGVLLGTASLLVGAACTVHHSTQAVAPGYEGKPPPRDDATFVTEEDSGLSLFGLFVVAEPDHYGFGMEANPAYLATLSGRYTVHLWKLRPYLGLGYLFKDTYDVGIRSHNVFAELGNTWVLHRTYRLSFGFGLRHRLAVMTTPGSLLDGPDVDPSLLQREIDDTPEWVPLLAVRFSRAF